MCKSSKEQVPVAQYASIPYNLDKYLVKYSNYNSTTNFNINTTRIMGQGITSDMDAQNLLLTGVRIRRQQSLPVYPEVRQDEQYT